LIQRARNARRHVNNAGSRCGVTSTRRRWCDLTTLLSGGPLAIGQIVQWRKDPKQRLWRISARRHDSRPSHVVIEGENYHALQLLLYLHEGEVDCIYIDPPYNTGARD
jgi:hypothetical protein